MRGIRGCAERRSIRPVLPAFRPADHGSDDVLGRVYEYFLGKFAQAEKVAVRAIQMFEKGDEHGCLAEALTTQGLALVHLHRPEEGAEPGSREPLLHPGPRRCGWHMQPTTGHLAAVSSPR